MEHRYIALIIGACLIVISISAIVIRYLLAHKKNKEISLNNEVKEEITK